MYPNESFILNSRISLYQWTSYHVFSIYLYTCIFIYVLPKGTVMYLSPLNKCIFSCVYRRIEEHLGTKKEGIQGQVWLSDLRFTASPWCGDSYAYKSLCTEKWIYSLCSALGAGKENAAITDVAIRSVTQWKQVIAMATRKYHVGHGPTSKNQSALCYRNCICILACEVDFLPMREYYSVMTITIFFFLPPIPCSFTWITNRTN